MYKGKVLDDPTYTVEDDQRVLIEASNVQRVNSDIRENVFWEDMEPYDPSTFMERETLFQQLMTGWPAWIIHRKSGKIYSFLSKDNNRATVEDEHKEQSTLSKNTINNNYRWARSFESDKFVMVQNTLTNPAFFDTVDAGDYVIDMDDHNNMYKVINKYSGYVYAQNPVGAHLHIGESDINSGYRPATGEEIDNWELVQGATLISAPPSEDVLMSGFGLKNRFTGSWSDTMNFEESAQLLQRELQMVNLRGGPELGGNMLRDASMDLDFLADGGRLVGGSSASAGIAGVGAGLGVFDVLSGVGTVLAPVLNIFGTVWTLANNRGAWDFEKELIAAQPPG